MMAAVPQVSSICSTHASHSVFAGSSIIKCGVRNFSSNELILRVTPGSSANRQASRGRRKGRLTTCHWSRLEKSEIKDGRSEEKSNGFTRTAVAAVLTAVFTVGDPFGAATPRHSFDTTLGTSDNVIFQELTRVIQTPAARASGLLQMPPTSLNNRYRNPLNSA